MTRLLLSGLDTVECAYYLRNSAGGVFNFDALALRREAARNVKRRDPVAILIGGREFLLGRSGTASGYPFVLANRDMTVQCGEFNSPSFFLTYRSEALWHQGALALHEGFGDWAHSVGLVGVRDESLSRVDFTFDFDLATVDFDEDCFVTLACKDAQHRRDRKVQTFRFGEGEIVLRVYDKSAEIRESSQKTWFHPLWGGQSEGVWRVEFQVRKAVLRRFSIRTFADLFTGCGDVLAYLVNTHTSLRMRQADSNRSRWPLHPLWLALQAHVASLPAQGVLREVDEQARLREQMLRLAVAVEGYLKKAAAIHTVRSGGKLPTHSQALEVLSGYLNEVHVPLTWTGDVQAKADGLRVVGW